MVQPPAEVRFVELLDHVNDMVRTALVVPEMASSEGPDTGTYNLGETQIQLFLENVGATLDSIAEALDRQLLDDFRLFNAGEDAPPLTIVFEPLDVKTKRALLAALLQLLASGAPLDAGEGSQLQPDWAAIAQDAGLPLQVVDAAERARTLGRALRERLAAMGGEPSGDGDGAPADGARATGGARAAARLAEGWDEAKHPRGGDGRFGDKGGPDAGADLADVSAGLEFFLGDDVLDLGAIRESRPNLESLRRDAIEHGMSLVGKSVTNGSTGRSIRVTKGSIEKKRFGNAMKAGPLLALAPILEKMTWRAEAGDLRGRPMVWHYFTLPTARPDDGLVVMVREDVNGDLFYDLALEDQGPASARHRFSEEIAYPWLLSGEASEDIIRRFGDPGEALNFFGDPVSEVEGC